MKTTVTTDASGNYSFADLPAGTYVVVPELQGKNFDPAFRQVEIIDESVIDEDFAAAELGLQPPPLPYIISGRVTAVTVGGVTPPVADLPIVLGSSDRPIQVTLTREDGTYQFSSLPNGHYYLTGTPSLYTWSPTVHSVAATGLAVMDHDVTGLDFTITPVMYISGNISGTPRQGVTINYVGPRSGSVLSDSVGNYTISPLLSGVYRFWPEYPDSYFNPSMRAAVLFSNQLNQTFIISASPVTPTTHLIRCAVTTPSILPNVRVAVTDHDGTEVASGVTAAGTGLVDIYVPNGLYGLTPTLAGYTFAPTTRACFINNSGTSVNQTFIWS